MVENTSILNGYETTTILEEQKMFHHHESVILVIVSALLCLFGLFANLVTFTVIAKSSKLSSSPFNLLIMSLCVSDFLSALISPFVIYRRTFGYFEYHLPVAFCKLTFGVDFWTNNATIQHILVFMILRFVAINFPAKRRKFTVKCAKILIFFIWFETCIANAVFFMVFPTVYGPEQKTPTGKACTVDRKMIPYVKRYMHYAFPIFLYIPMLLVILLSLLLIFKVAQRKSKHTQEAFDNSSTLKKENFALLQLALIVSSFIIGYVPDIAYRITTVSYFASGSKFHGREPWQFFLTAHMCLRISECLNPIFYNLASGTLRKATIKFLRCEKRSVDNEPWNHESDLETEETKHPNNGNLGETKM